MKQHQGYNLVALYKKRDERACHILYRELFPAVFSYANKIVKNSQIAEDICIESFVKLFESSQTFQAAGNLKSYLFTVTHNACLDALKMLKRHASIHREIEHQMETEFDLTKHQIEAELVELIYKSIENLPPQCKTVCKLIIEGLNSDEIAKALNISPSTVRNQKARGVKLLRLALIEEDKYALIALVITILLSCP